MASLESKTKGGVSTETPPATRTAPYATPTTTVRRADPDDSEFLAWAILAASRAHGIPGVFDLAIPESEEDRMDVAEWMVLSDLPNFCEPRHFFIREQNDESVAAMCGYDGADPNMGSLAPALSDAFDGLAFEPGEFASALDRLTVYQTCAPRVDPGNWVIEWVATRPDYRSQGHARVLLTRTLDEGRERGHSRAQVSTTIGNTPAIRLYESMGFEVADERRNERFEQHLGCPGMVTMVVDL